MKPLQAPVWQQGAEQTLVAHCPAPHYHLKDRPGSYDSTCQHQLLGSAAVHPRRCQGSVGEVKCDLEMSQHLSAVRCLDCGGQHYTKVLSSLSIKKKEDVLIPHQSSFQTEIMGFILFLNTGWSNRQDAAHVKRWWGECWNTKRWSARRSPVLHLFNRRLQGMKKMTLSCRKS